MRSMTTGVLERVAASLRRRSEQVEPHYSTTTIIDSCFPNMTVTGMRLRGGLHEAVRVDEGGLLDGRGHRRRHVLVYNRALPHDEQRFAIAHGLAHVIFDGATPRACSTYDAERERRCDEFAETLLVPLEELEPYVCRNPDHRGLEHQTDVYQDMVDMIASHFHAPARIIHKRIQELRRADLRHFNF